MSEQWKNLTGGARFYFLGPCRSLAQAEICTWHPFAHSLVRYKTRSESHNITTRYQYWVRDSSGRIFSHYNFKAFMLMEFVKSARYRGVYNNTFCVTDRKFLTEKNEVKLQRRHLWRFSRVAVTWAIAGRPTEGPVGWLCPFAQKYLLASRPQIPRAVIRAI